MSLISIVYSFLSTVGFAVLFNIPRKAIINSGLCGAMGWLAYIYFQETMTSTIFASFAGAFIVGLMGEIFARLKKQPATIFVVPGIIPLVPGYGLYYSMLKILEKDYQKALSLGFEAIIVAIAIASAVIISSSLGKTFRDKRRMKQES